MITFILAVCGNVDYVYSFPQSPPSRAAWIEICKHSFCHTSRHRRRLHGRRGLKFDNYVADTYAKESPPSRAAWIEIGLTQSQQNPLMSPPSRAAWIEMENAAALMIGTLSRRLHGRRGLKFPSCAHPAFGTPSPPSRAAWIEITVLQGITQIITVAAFTGGVD